MAPTSAPTAPPRSTRSTPGWCSSTRSATASSARTSSRSRRRCSCSRPTTTSSKFGQEVARRPRRRRRSVSRSPACSRSSTSRPSSPARSRRCCRSSPPATTSAFANWLRAIAAGARDRQQFLATATARRRRRVRVGLQRRGRPARPAAPAELERAAADVVPRPVEARARRPATSPSYERQSARLDHAINGGDREHRRSGRPRRRRAPARDVWVYGGVAVVAMLAHDRADVDRRPRRRAPAAQAHRERTRHLADTSSRSSSSSSVSVVTCRRCSSRTSR